MLEQALVHRIKRIAKIVYGLGWANKREAPYRAALNCAPCDRVLSVRRNTLRVDLERAVVQLPSTEKMIFLMHDVEGYDHARIAYLLNVSKDDSCRAVHQARLRLRELLAKS